MTWFTDRTSFLLAVVCYGLSAGYSVFLYRKGFRKDDYANSLLLFAGFCLHTAAMIMRGFSFNRCPVNNLYEATIFVLWTIVAVCLVLGLFPRLRFVGAFASPLLVSVGVFALMPGLDGPAAVKPEFKNGWVSLHAASILLAYGCFGLSGVSGVMYLTQERDLKRRRARAIFALIPPIQRLEIATRRLVTAGFVLLTLGLLIGRFRIELPEGTRFFGDPKVLWSALVWAAYLALLATARLRPLGGRRLSWAAVGCFAFVILTFWGANLMSPIHR